MEKKSNMADIAEVLASYAVCGDMQAVADRMGVPYSTLMRKLNPHDAYQINATEVIPLILVTGNYSLIEHFCSRLNVLAVPMGNTEAPGALDVHAIARFAKESGEALSAMSAAIADGRLTKREARQCRKELMELVQVAWAALKSLEYLG